MDILLARVTYLCKKYNVSFYALEKANQLSDSSVKRWGKSPPSSERLLRVARYFGVSTDFLLGNTDNPKSHLNQLSYDSLLKNIKTVVCDWKAQISEGSAGIEAKLDNILEQYGTKSESGIAIYSDDILNDPELPR